jgi:hypothetical protein
MKISLKSAFIGLPVPKLGPVLPSISAQLAARAVDIIKARTAKGLSMSLVPFRPYTARYAAWRKDHGLRTRPVNLRVSGAMLGALRVIQQRGSISEVGWTDSRQATKAEANENLGRPFLGIIAPADMQQMQAYADKLFRSALPGVR